jgi:ribosomal protein S18 acetylase RimI-like enzyme
MNIEIREATIEDINIGLLDVFIEGYRFHQNGRPDIFNNISDETLKEDLIKNFENLSTLIILDDNKVVGYLAYRIKEKHTKKIDVDQLVIIEQYRGKGLGKKLMDEVKNIGFRNNCDRIELNCWMFNENALAMYEHIGFERQRIIYELKLK